MANTAQAIGMNYTDFKQMLHEDVWPEVSRRQTHICNCRPTNFCSLMTHKVSFLIRMCWCLLLPHLPLSMMRPSSSFLISLFASSRSIECRWLEIRWHFLWFNYSSGFSSELWAGAGAVCVSQVGNLSLMSRDYDIIAQVTQPKDRKTLQLFFFPRWCW